MNKKRSNTFNTNINFILSKCIDIASLLKTQIKLFDFSKLEFIDKLALLEKHPDIFIDIIDINRLSIDEKASIYNRIKNKIILDKIIFTPNELIKLSNNLSIKYILDKFDDCISVDLYNKLDKQNKIEIFLYNPSWVLTNIKIIPKLSSKQLNDISVRKPKIIEQYITDFTKLSTRYSFWCNMIRYDSKYKEIFLKNIKYCTNKTEARHVIYEYPELITMLNENIINNSKLTCKEWLATIKFVMDNDKDDKFKDWKFSDNMIEIFKLDIMAEVIKGKSTLSPQLRNAMKIVFDNT